MDATRISRIPKAKKAGQPTALRPQLATLVADVPNSDAWLHEIKYDGYRILGFVRDGRVRLVTRKGQDWTTKFPTIAAAVAALPIRQAILDGEVVVQKGSGATDFQALQNVLQGKYNKYLMYYVFDLPHCGGFDLTAAPLAERKRLLQEIVAADPAKPTAVRFSDHIQGHGPDVLRQACGMALEGIISKRADSPYVQKRTPAWTKSKCIQRQEFVIGGFTDPSGSRTGFGALVVGYHDGEGHLVYCGRVGTGFSEKALAAIHAALRARQTSVCPFRNPPTGREAKGVHWIRPELVGEVRFGSWTDDGMLRHPSFQGLRADKDPKDVRLEVNRPSATRPD